MTSSRLCIRRACRRRSRACGRSASSRDEERSEETTMLYCPIARNFYRLRRVLCECLELPRSSIRPSTPLASLIPLAERNRVLARLLEEDLAILPTRMSYAHILATIVGTLAWALVLAIPWLLLERTLVHPAIYVSG